MICIEISESLAYDADFFFSQAAQSICIILPSSNSNIFKQKSVINQWAFPPSPNKSCINAYGIGSQNSFSLGEMVA